MQMVCRTIGLAVLVLGTAAAAPAAADELIFADVLNPGDPLGNSIRGVSTGGLGLRTIVPTGGGVRGIDVDVATGRVYWTDVDNFVIRRARLDGTGQEDVVTAGLAFPSALRLNPTDGKVYWGDQTNEELVRVNTDGTVREPLTTTPFFRGLAIDHVNARMYWTVSITASTGRILRANLDGTDQQTVIPTSGANFKPGNIALDLAGGKIYWTDAVARFLRRANLDGTNIENLFDGTFVGPPKGLVLDLVNAQLYWGLDVRDFDSDGFLYGEIRRMNLDGSDQQAIVTGLGSVNDLVLVPDQDCTADFNNGGDITVQDIFDFLAAYFGNDPQADFNGERRHHRAGHLRLPRGVLCRMSVNATGLLRARRLHHGDTESTEECQKDCSKRLGFSRIPAFLCGLCVSVVKFSDR